MNALVANLADDHPIRDILAMIERKAPKLMRSGGGSLPAEKAPWDGARRQRSKLSGQDRYRIRSLRRDGLTFESIAREVGRSISVVERACKQEEAK